MVPRTFFFRLLVCGCLLPAALSNPSPAAPCQDYPLPEDGLLGSVALPHDGNNIVRHGSLAFVGFGLPEVQVVGLSSPHEPALLGTLTSDMVMVNASSWIEPVDNLAFMGGGWFKVPIFDLTDPSLPTVVGQLDVPYEVTATARSGDFFFVTTYTPGFPEDPFDPTEPPPVPVTTFHVFDISDPGAPVELSEIIDNHDRATQMIADGKTIFMRTGSGLHTFDLSDPAVMIELDFLGIYVNRFQCVGDLLYATNSTGSLFIVDISDPSNLTLLNTADYESVSAGSLSIQDSIVLTACGSAGVRIVDVSDPLDCPSPGVWSTDDSCNGVLLDGATTWLLVGNTLMAVASDFPEAAPPLGSETFTRYPEKMVLQGDLLFQVDGGLRIIDLSDPAFPILLGAYEDANNYQDLAVSGDVVCLVSTGETVAVDVSDPADPVYLSTLTTDQMVSVAASGSCFFLGPRSGTLTAWDLTVPETPLLLGTQTGVGDYRAYELVVEGGYAYVINAQNLQVVDVSDPNDLLNVASIPEHAAYGLSVSDGIVYALTFSHMVTYEFTPAAGLTLLSDVPLPGNGFNVHSSNNLVYVSCGHGGVQIFGVDDPAAPVRVGAIMPDAINECVATDQDLIIVGNRVSYSGVAGFIEVHPRICFSPGLSGTGDDAPTRLPAMAVYPNPFNPMTTISFDLPRSGLAVIKIFSVRGELIAGLGDEFYEAGRHEVVWTGRDRYGREMPSGSFFAKLYADGKAVGSVTKMSLVR